MNRYFVTEEHVGFNVLCEAWDNVAGNYYKSMTDGFETESLAQQYADKLNSDKH